ncbi:MAG: ATP synthase F1 subunit epsilon [Planctomycetales bacterium]|nr:ATP synthase F1 subunit epsilon [Planctomycetales bacterium]
MADKPTLNKSAMHLVVVTPEATALDTLAKFVALPLFDGEIGIAPLHSPMIGRLGYGEMRITGEDGARKTFYIDGGFVQVADNVVSVLTNRAIAGDKVDAAAAAQQVADAKAMHANSDELFAIRDRQLAQGRAQLLVAERAKQ